MEMNPIYIWHGKPLPFDHPIITGSNAQDCGGAPFADYVWVDADGKLDPTMRSYNRHAFETCHCDEPCVFPTLGHLEMVERELPTTRPDGTPLVAGDICNIWLHGDSETYQDVRRWDGEQWTNWFDTIPWQLKS